MKRKIAQMTSLILINASLVWAQAEIAPIQPTELTSGELQEDLPMKLINSTPDIYMEIQGIKARQQQAVEIAADYHARKITPEEAEQKLYPLLSENVKLELPYIDSQIEQLKNQIRILEEAKWNPDVLIKKRIEEVLGIFPTFAPETNTQ
jgi:hypothetical protein